MIVWACAAFLILGREASVCLKLIQTRRNHTGVVGVLNEAADALDVAAQVVAYRLGVPKKSATPNAKLKSLYSFGLAS